MKRKSITIYSIVITLVFTFAIAFFGYNIFLELKTGNIRSKKIFDTLTTNILNLSESDKISSIIQNTDYYSALYISNNQEILVSYPNDNAINAENTNLVKVYKKEIKNDNNVYNITAAIYTLRPSTIFYYARFSFIIIMIATIFTTILIIYFSLTTKNDDVITLESNDENNDKNLDEQPEDDSLEQKEIENESFDTMENNNGAEVKKEETTNLDDKEIINTEEFDNDINEIQFDNSSENINIDNKQDEDISFQNQNEDNEAKDMFSPVTGFCWESQLKNRLETELIRASSSEQDIALFLIKIPNISFTDDITKEIADYLLKEIQFRDKIFEYKNDTFAVIKTETSIDEAEDYAECLQKNISEIVHSVEKDCFIGISSRSIRMLSADRLITEADEALKHAEDDKSSKIIGFHVDIEKYRQFINNN